MPGSGPLKIPVVFYRTHGGGEVVRDWLRSLDDADRRAVVAATFVLWIVVAIHAVVGHEHFGDIAI